MQPDELDVKILRAMTDDPQVSVLALSRRLGVARGTVQSRLERMQRTGAVDFAPAARPDGFGYPVTAFVSLVVEQTNLGHPAAQQISEIPEVVEIHSISGAADLFIKVVARSNAHLQRVIDSILQAPSVVRTSSSIVLKTHLEHRTLPVFERASVTENDD